MTIPGRVTAPTVEEAGRLDAEAAERRMSFLYEATTSVFAADIDARGRIERLASAAVPDIADWCLVELLEGDKLTRAALTHWSPPCEAEQLFADESAIDESSLAVWAMKTGRCVGPLDARPTWEKHMPPGWQALGSHSFVIIPLRHGPRIFGVVTFAFVESMREFGPAEIALATDLAARTSQSLESARLYAEAGRARAEAEGARVLADEALGRAREAEIEKADLVRRLEQALESRDAFLAVAAHDIRNPISNIMLQMERMERQLGGDAPKIAPALETIEKVKRQVRRTADLLHDLLDVTRMRTGKLQLAFAPMDLVPLTTEIIARFEEESTTTGSTITLTADGPATGVWDRGRIDQVITNLVSNAIKYGRCRPIAVRITASDTAVTLTIADQGIGIDLADQARIFDRFERATKEQIQGIGVGLWIVQQIVLGHQGTVEVQSAPGQGSTFVMTLPKTPAG